MKTIMTSEATNGMFLLNKETTIKMDSEAPIIESIFETIVEPIIYKCQNKEWTQPLISSDAFHLETCIRRKNNHQISKNQTLLSQF